MVNVIGYKGSVHAYEADTYTTRCGVAFSNRGRHLSTRHEADLSEITCPDCLAFLQGTTKAVIEPVKETKKQNVKQTTTVSVTEKSNNWKRMHKKPMARRTK